MFLLILWADYQLFCSRQACSSHHQIVIRICFRFCTVFVKINTNLFHLFSSNALSRLPTFFLLIYVSEQKDKDKWKISYVKNYSNATWEAISESDSRHRRLMKRKNLLVLLYVRGEFINPRHVFLPKKHRFFCQFLMDFFLKSRSPVPRVEVPCEQSL